MHIIRLFAAVIGVFILQPTVAFNIYTDIEAGNLIIDKIRNDSIWVRPDLRTTNGDWFYWNFAVNNAKDKKLTFIFPSETEKPNMQYLTSRGPALSLDGGWVWSWLNEMEDWGRSFTYTFKTDKEVRFSMAMPYTRRNFIRFIEPYLSDKNTLLDTIGISESNRPIDRLTLKPKCGEIKHKVLITSRMHACEMMGSYVLEGIIMHYFTDEWLKSNVEIGIIPFVDIDGVENGDQGKNKNGRDHNRDYTESSIYYASQALRNWIPSWAENKLTVAIDIHCPWIRYGPNETIFIIGNENPIIDREIKRFCKQLRMQNNGELKVSDKIYMDYISTTSPGKSLLQHITQRNLNLGINLALALEFPYAANENQTVTQKNAQLFGIDIAKALKVYLKNAD